MRDGKYYCSSDYQTLFGTKCSGCGLFVEGEVVTALGNTYHQKMFPLCQMQVNLSFLLIFSFPSLSLVPEFFFCQKFRYKNISQSI